MGADHVLSDKDFAITKVPPTVDHPSQNKEGNCKYPLSSHPSSHACCEHGKFKNK